VGDMGEVASEGKLLPQLVLCHAVGRNTLGDRSPAESPEMRLRPFNIGQGIHGNDRRGSAVVEFPTSEPFTVRSLISPGLAFIWRC